MGTAPSVRVYWITWAILLVLTVVMLAVDTVEAAAAVVLPALLGAMLLKATMIAGWFMHLREETRALVWAVAAGILVTGAILFWLIVPDGHAAFVLGDRGP